MEERDRKERERERERKDRESERLSSENTVICTTDQEGRFSD